MEKEPAFISNLYKDRKEPEFLKIIHHSVFDDRGTAYDLYAFHDGGYYYTKLYLLEGRNCIDSFLLQDDSPYLLRFDLLPSKKRIHAIYDMRSSGCTSYFYQAIIQIKNKRIFIPLLANYESNEHCLTGIKDDDLVDSTSVTNELNLNMLDLKNICKFNTTRYSRTYSKSKKPIIETSKDSYSLAFDPSTGVYCDSLKYFNLEYKNCKKEKKTLEGIYPVKQYGDDGDGGKYFEVFIDREWYVHYRGRISPLSDPCY
jgi:hypothetical protein